MGRQRFLFLSIPVLIFIAFLIGTKIGKVGFPYGAVAGSLEKFEYLAKQQSNVCARLSAEQLSTYPEDARLAGSCCGPMDFHSYSEQVEGLKKYKSISQIPKDPYDIPVTLAKELLSYKDNITLNSDQQKVYDEATELSHEGGPCCCRCWRWDAFEGLAKYLITQNNFTSEQIAKIWDLEDGCGGSGH
ncbi:hypothetical protein HYV21_00110 [Candidatus Microgenomates bacterium]|nr:hypothetical protein [Candidatus Microgenomates bacterium]